MSKKMKKRPAYAAQTAEPAKEKGSPVKEPAEIKMKKKRPSRSAVAGIIVGLCAAAGVAFLILNGIGLLPRPNVNPGGKMKLESYNPLEISADSLSMVDVLTEGFMGQAATDMMGAETITEGKVEDRDEVVIDYTGILKETGEAFEGGSAEDYTLRIGSGTFIEGFEDGLIGAEIGKDTVLDLTFPDDYQEGLAGKDVSFTVTVKSASRTQALTDEKAAQYAKDNNLDIACNNVSDLETYAHDMYYDAYIQNIIDDKMKELQTVERYDKKMEKRLNAFLTQSLQEEAESSNLTKEEQAKNNGYETFEEYVDAKTHEYLDIMMWSDHVLRHANITWTGADVDSELLAMMQQSESTSSMSLDEFKSRSGQEWLWLYENLDFKHKKAVEVLTDYVKIVPAEAESEENSDSEQQ